MPDPSPAGVGEGDGAGVPSGEPAGVAVGTACAGEGDDWGDTVADCDSGEEEGRAMGAETEAWIRVPSPSEGRTGDSPLKSAFSAGVSSTGGAASIPN